MRPLATHAGDAKKVDEASVLAKQLGYKHDATQVDLNAFPKRAASDAQDQFCRTCQFFGGTPEDEWGECVVFGGELVNSGGWCDSWYKRVS